MKVTLKTIDSRSSATMSNVNVVKQVEEGRKKAKRSRTCDGTGGWMECGGVRRMSVAWWFEGLEIRVRSLSQRRSAWRKPVVAKRWRMWNGEGGLGKSRDGERGMVT
jgi:hypothetical protein